MDAEVRRRLGQGTVGLKAAGLALASVMAVLEIAASAGASTRADWIGDRYGWRGAEGGFLQATIDGGKHWRNIFEEEVWGFAHTGPVTGMVSTGVPGGGDQEWTVDNGRHWYFAASIGKIQALAGHGRYLFWGSLASSGNGRLVQVTPWPPGKAQLRCPGGFEVIAGPGLSCVRAASQLRSTTVATVANGEVYRLADAPGGVVGLVRRVDTSSTATAYFRVLIRRFGKTRVVNLSPLTPTVESGISTENSMLFVDWPRVEVVALSSTGSTSAVWLSRDGGGTWMTYP